MDKRRVMITKFPWKGMRGYIIFSNKNNDLLTVIIDATGQRVVVNKDSVRRLDEDDNILFIEDPNNPKKSPVFMMSQDDIHSVSGKIVDDGIAVVSFDKNSLVKEVSGSLSKLKSSSKEFEPDFFETLNVGQIELVKNGFTGIVRDIMDILLIDHDNSVINSHSIKLDTIITSPLFASFPIEKEEMKLITVAYFFTYFNQVGAQIPIQPWMKNEDITPNDDPGLILDTMIKKRFIKNVDKTVFISIVKKILSVLDISIHPSKVANVSVPGLRKFVAPVKTEKSGKKKIIPPDTMKIIIVPESEADEIAGRRTDDLLKSRIDGIDSGIIKLPDYVDKQLYLKKLSEFKSAPLKFKEHEIPETKQERYIQDEIVKLAKKHRTFVFEARNPGKLDISSNRTVAENMVISNIDTRISQLKNKSFIPEDGIPVDVMIGVLERFKTKIRDGNYVNNLKSNSIEKRIVGPFYRQYLTKIKDQEDDHYNRYVKRVKVFPETQEAFDLKKKLIFTEKDRLLKGIEKFKGGIEVGILKHIIEDYNNIISLDQRSIRDILTDNMSGTMVARLKAKAIVEASMKFKRRFNTELSRLKLQ